MAFKSVLAAAETLDDGAVVAPEPEPDESLVRIMI